MGEWPDDIDVPAQVFINDNLDASEIAARDEFNRKRTRRSAASSCRATCARSSSSSAPGGTTRASGSSSPRTASSRRTSPSCRRSGNSVRHRHTTEAVIYIVKGSGYSICNYEGQPEERDRLAGGHALLAARLGVAPALQHRPDEPARYLAVQDTGLIRHMRFHQIERHPSQLKIGEGTDYVVNAVPAGAAVGADSSNP